MGRVPYWIWDPCFPSTTLGVTFVLLGRELGRDSMEKPGQVTAILGIWDREVCSMFYKLGSFKHPSSQILASGWGLARRELEQ